LLTLPIIVADANGEVVRRRRVGGVLSLLPPPACGRGWGWAPFYRTFAQVCVLHSGQTTQPFTVISLADFSVTVAV